MSHAPRDSQRVLDALAETAARLCDARDARIFRVDGDRLRLVARHGSSRTPRAPGEAPPLSRSTIHGRAVLDRRTVQAGAAIATPMLSNGALAGVIAIRRAKATALSAKQVNLLESFAAQAAIVLQELDARARELLESREQQTATAEILRVISSSPGDLQPVFDTIARNAVRLCEAAFAYVFRFDGTLMHVAAHHNLTGDALAALERQWPMRPDRRSVPARAILDRRVIHVTDVLDEPDHPYLATSRALGIRTMLTTPMLRDGQPIGAVAVYRQEVEPFTEQQIALVATFASQAVIAVENVRLFQEREAKNRELAEALEQQTATAEILRAIAGSPTDIQPVLETVVRAAGRFCGATDVLLLRLDGTTLRGAAGMGQFHDVLVRQLGSLAALEIPVTHGTVTGRAVLERRTVHVQDLAVVPEGEFPEGRELQQRFGHHTTAATPLLREGTPVGVIALFRMVVDPFSDRQLELLRVFADQAVIAIENVRLFTELEAKNRDLTETLEQQTATGEILRAISSSPTDVQPVFDTIARSVMRLCEGGFAVVNRYDGNLMHLAAHAHATPEGVDVMRQIFPMRPSRINLVGRAILTGAVVNVTDVRTDADYNSTLSDTLGNRSSIAVPMLRDGQPIGAIFVGRLEVRPFSDAHIALLHTFADQAVIAIENVRLFKELEARNRDLTETLEQQTATSEILRVISSSPTDVQPVFDTIVRSAVRLCDGLFGAVNMFDGEMVHRPVAYHNYTPDAVAAVQRMYPTRPSRQQLTGRAVLSRTATQVPDVLNDPEYMPDVALAGGWRAGLAVPMLREDQPIGTILVTRAGEGAFSDRQIALLQTFADQAVIAIENVRLFTELEARNRDLTETLEQQIATGEILRTISQSPTDVQPVFDTIAASAFRLCSAKWGAVTRFDGEMMHLVSLHNVSDPDGAEALWRAFPRPPSRRGATDRAVLTRAVTYIPDVREDPEYQLQDLAQAAGYRSQLSVPMLREGQPVGAITVAGASPGAFSERQIALLQTFADQAVIAIENVRLFKELEAKNRDLTETLEQQTATGEILRVISSSPTDVQPVFDTIAQSVVRLCGGLHSGVYTFDGSLIHFVAHHSWTDEGLELVRPMYPRAPSRETVIAAAILDCSVVEVRDFENDPGVPAASLPPARALGYRSILVVPMLREGRAIGAITAPRAEPGPFSPKQVELLKTFADQAVIAIENVRLFTEVQARNRELTDSLQQQTATGEILRVISGSPTDVQPVFDTIARSAVRLCDAQFCAVFRFDGQSLHFVAHHGMTPEGIEATRHAFPAAADRGSAAGRSVISVAVEHIPDVQADPDYTFGGLAHIAAFRSIVAVPMVRDGVPIGSITVRRAQAGGFPDQQIDLLKTFADQAVIAIENVRLFTELADKNRALTEAHAQVTEALEQQTATSEILRVISSSPTDVQPVFDAIVRSAVRLCDGLLSGVYTFDGNLIHFVAHHNWTGAALETASHVYPRVPSRETQVATAILDRIVVQVRDFENEPGVPAPSLPLARALGYRSILVVPMLRDRNPIGAIAVARAAAGAFSVKQIELLKTFADQAVIAIENVRLFKELEAKNRDLTETLEQQTATGEILRVISSSPTDVQPVFDTIARSAARLCEARDAVVYLVDADVLNPVARHGPVTAGSIPLVPGTLGGRTVIERRTMNVADLQAEVEEFPVGAAISQREGTRSMVSVPLLLEDRTIGTIAVRRFEVRPFSDAHIALLQTFAAQAVIAIQNVRLFQELEARNRDLTETLEQQTATAGILRVISSSPTDVQPVFDTIAERAMRLCDAAQGVVATFDGELVHLAALANFDARGVEAMRGTFPRRPDRGFAMGRAILTKAVAHIPSLADDPEYLYGDVAQETGFRSALGVPMVREGAIIGVVGVTRLVTGPFSDRQIDLLKTFADQAVIAIENVRLFQELETRTHDLTRSVGELRALGEVSQAVGSSLDLETVLETIVSRAVQLSGSQSGIVYEFDEATGTFQARATHRISLEHLEAVRAAPIRLGEGAIGRAGVAREPVQIADIEGEWDLVAPQVRTLLIRDGTHSLLAVPLVREERLLGGLVILRRERGAFSPEVVATMQTFAAQSVLAINNAGLFREIQRQKQYADALVQTSPVAIVTMDLGGAVVGWNPGAERLFGYTPAEALGQRMEDLVATPEVREEIRANIRQTLGGEWIRAIGRRARKDRTLVDVEISSMPVVVEGAKVGMLGIYHDITELLRARREAEAANEAKSAFLATMSHEIRTPMNAVIGMSGLLLGTALTDEQREYAEIVRQSGDALLTVINDILDFSKIEAGKLELESQPFDLRECVEGALDLVASRAAEKGLDLAYLVGDGAPAAIVGDVTRLRQILLNLLSNAVKFTERGEVVLSVGARPVDGAAGFHELTFSVRDTGIGIPPERLDRLFQSFSQVDASTTRRYGGTGLGLAISQRLTDLMGGRIDVTSEVGRGSEFRFTIRAAAAEAPVSTRRDLSGVQTSLRGKRVLVVDDNATNRRILTAHLDAWGLPVGATGSPVEALGWIRADERFDVGILDMHMPEMDGVTLARAIREQPAGTALPLVLFTSLGRREARAEDEGFAAYLSKPIKPSQLFDALVSVLADRPVHVRERGVARSELDPDMARRHPLRILLAEDNVVNQKVALRLLGQMGYRADVAANGIEAIDAVARQTYDVILMDVQMPELDGFEASREINRRWPGGGRPRLVAMTANAMQGDRELCVAAGMDDYVSKPVRIEELVSALERCRPRADREAGGGSGVAGPAPAPTTKPPTAGSVLDPPGEGSSVPAPKSPSAPTAAAIDRATFDRLTATMGGAFAIELIDTFLEDARDLLAALRKALAATDLDGSRRAAHSLKSTSETLGATGLAALARDLEAMARAGTLDGAGDRLDRLAVSQEAVARTLGELRRGLLP